MTVCVCVQIPLMESSQRRDRKGEWDSRCMSKMDLC